MLSILEKSPVVTAVFVIYAIVGGIICITNPQTMTFADYTTRLVAFGAAVGIARGYVAGKKQEGVPLDDAYEAQLAEGADPDSVGDIPATPPKAR